MYCEQCGVHTLHDDTLCTVCFPFERRLEILRQVGPEVSRDEEEESEGVSPLQKGA